MLEFVNATTNSECPVNKLYFCSYIYVFVPTLQCQCLVHLCLEDLPFQDYKYFEIQSGLICSQHTTPVTHIEVNEFAHGKSPI